MAHLTQQQADRLVDAGELEVAMQHGRWWRVRRNGRTQTWKTRPGHYRIPLKMGLRGYTELTHSDVVEECREERNCGAFFRVVGAS